MAIKYYRIPRLLIPSHKTFDSGAERCFLSFPFCFSRSSALWCNCGIMEPSSRPTQNSALNSPPLLPLWTSLPAPSSCVQTLKSPPALTVSSPLKSDCCFQSLFSWILVHTGAELHFREGSGCLSRVIQSVFPNVEPACSFPSNAACILLCELTWVRRQCGGFKDHPGQLPFSGNVPHFLGISTLLSSYSSFKSKLLLQAILNLAYHSTHSGLPFSMILCCLHLQIHLTPSQASLYYSLYYC